MTEVHETIKNSTSDSILFAHKAFLLLENKGVDEALELCEAGVKRFPFYAEGHFILGKCYQTKKKYDEAKEEYERTLLYMPGHIRAFNALSFIYHKKNLPGKGNDLLLLAAIHNPYNTDLINYLKNENIYDQLYAESEHPAVIPETVAAEVTEKIELPLKNDEAVMDELASDIQELMPGAEDESVSFDSETALTEWEKDADQIKAEDLFPFSFSEKDIEDSTIQFGDSEIIDFEKDHGSDLDEKLFKDAVKKDSDQVSWDPETEAAIPEQETPDSDLQEIPIQDSELDESYLLEDDNDDFFLGPESTDSGQETEDTTKIDNYASSKDEITELSIEQYEVNSIVDNIIESDQRDSSKPDLSKFANTEDDFSTLMDGIFEKKRDFSDDEFFEDELGESPESDKLDDAELAEERPILDTSIIFPNRIKADQKNEADSSDGLDTGSGTEEDLEFDLAAMEGEFGNEDEITKVIDQIEKAGTRPKRQVKSTAKKMEPATSPEPEDLASLDDENVNIDEILANPKMLTPTFGEILIAQKKFEDARRVFAELSKREPENQRLTRKIDFLDKLVQFNK